MKTTTNKTANTFFDKLDTIISAIFGVAIIGVVICSVIVMLDYAGVIEM